MAGGDERPPLQANWRRLVDGWIKRGGLRYVADDDSVSVDFDVPDAERTVTVRFMATARLLVAFMTDGRSLDRDQIALAAAAANAWNTEQLIPVLSVWDVRGPQPCLAGTCVLPLSVRMDAATFDGLAGDWIDRAGRMFIRCHQVFDL